MKSVAATSVAVALSVSGLALFSGAASAAAKKPLVSAVCNLTVSAGTGTIVGSLIAGVTPGSTKITFDCNDSTGAAILAEASILGAIGTTSVSQSGEADTAALGDFTASSTDTGCPAAAAGSCTVAIFTVPATFTAGDAKAVCPPTQAEINDGLIGCALAVATAAAAPVAGAEYVMTYASQTTPPNAPSITATPAEGVAGGTVKVSDAASNTGYWWGNAIQTNQAIALGVAPTAAPASCTSGSAYGDVPAAFLAVNWFAGGSTTAIPGSAAGVTISNDCYDGTTLYGPVLGGTIPVPSAIKVGATYKVYLCELNLTQYPSNDPNSAADCGAAPAGESWIDASFSFNGALGPINQAAPLSGTTSPGTATSVQLNVTGNSGTVSFITSSAPIAGLSVTSTGLVSSSTSLAVGSYTVSGTDSDTSGDSGSWTYTLSVGTAQAPLTITSLSGTLGNFLTLAVSGGSGTGAVTFSVTNGTAGGCAIAGNNLSATSAGTCLVTATKAGDTTYLPVSSSATSVPFSALSAVKLRTHTLIVSSNTRVVRIVISCGNTSCSGTLSGTFLLKRKAGGATIEQSIRFRAVAYHLNRESARSIAIALPGAAIAYLRNNPSRPNNFGLLEVTDNLGKKHSSIGRVSLLK